MTRLFLRIFKQKSSASGEVGANQNMQEIFESLKNCLEKNKLWSNLEEKSQN